MKKKLNKDCKISDDAKCPCYFYVFLKPNHKTLHEKWHCSHVNDHKTQLNTEGSENTIKYWLSTT